MAALRSVESAERRFQVEALVNNLFPVAAQNVLDDLFVVFVEVQKLLARLEGVLALHRLDAKVRVFLNALDHENSVDRFAEVGVLHESVVGLVTSFKSFEFRFS